RVAHTVAVGVGLGPARGGAAVPVDRVAVVALLAGVARAVAAARAPAVGAARVGPGVAVGRAVVALLALRDDDAVAADGDAGRAERHDVGEHGVAIGPHVDEARATDTGGPRAVRGPVGHEERRPERVAGRVPGARARTEELAGRIEVLAPD